MNVDTEIRHVTKAGANLFLELGFTAAEAKKLHVASRKQINDTRLLKQQLMAELSNWITEHPLHQANAARILMVSQARASDAATRGLRSSRSKHRSRWRAASESPCSLPRAEPARAMTCDAAQPMLGARQVGTQAIRLSADKVERLEASPS